ncbi:MAG: aspartyl protease family protein [Patescibacteria group bacterium]|nr:aspartyl protease family protein [Patescibacteria group bacterium]
MNWKLIAGLKITVMAGIILVAGLGFAWQKKNAQINQTGVKNGFSSLINQADGAILTIPYQQTLYKHFGNAINPQVKIPVKTITGYKKIEFLIDSGAVVSALPKTMAVELGVNLSELPRITIEGFAGQKTFAYRGEFVIMIGNEEVIIPVVFSENPQASNILGRIGFFDQFNILFDAEDQSIIISKKQ